MLAGAALAHPGVPGHVHPEMTAFQQAVHAVENWLPLALIAVAAGLGAMRAARGNS